MGVADEEFLESDFTHRRGFLVWWDRGCVERDLKKLVCEGKICGVGSNCIIPCELSLHPPLCALPADVRIMIV